MSENGDNFEVTPKEIERKFLIKKPTETEIKNLNCISKSNIVQTYLIRNDDDVERRVRQRGTKEDGYQLYYTEKRNIKDGERFEREVTISPDEYISYLAEADTVLHQISKVRYCFIYKDRCFEMDLYPFSDKYAIFEIELDDINEEIDFPPLKIIKEVTNDKKYRNSSLARNLELSE